MPTNTDEPAVGNGARSAGPSSFVSRKLTAPFLLLLLLVVVAAAPLAIAQRSSTTQGKEKTMIILIGHIHIDPSDVTEFAADAQAITNSTKAETGCLFYNVSLEDASAGRFLLVQRWQDQNALTAHTNNQEAAFLKKWTSRMTVDVKKYDALNERSL